MPELPAIASGAPPLGVSYAQLQAQGLAHLQQLGGEVWTDHNSHDPGITILEQLCYVLSDLAYRANYDIRDLLVEPPGAGSASSLFSPPEILTTNPVTILDLRKLVLDVEGVKNAWIEPAQSLQPPLYYDPGVDALSFPGASSPATLEPLAIRGVYRVLVAPQTSGPNPSAIQQRLNASRPLGMDFLAPAILQEQKVSVIAEIEIDHAHVASEVLREVYRVAIDYVSPRIRFHTLAEMLGRGQTLDEIFDGPPLQHGFIDTEELARLERAFELRTSDLLALFMEIDGVRAVHELRLKKDGGPEEPWVLDLEASQTPVLDLQTTAITLIRGRARWNPPIEEVGQITESLARWDVRSPAAAAAPDLPVLFGRDRQVERYHSLQHHLPQVYGVGPAGLPSYATPARQAQVRQLRAYLMLFDQVLANCFSQLAHARDLFSFNSAPDVPPTYFSQLPADVPDGGDILDTSLDARALQEMVETAGGAAARQQRFLDHLLARFAEDFSGYQLHSQVLLREANQRLAAQRAFLRDYPAVSGGLGRGFDYTQPSWGDANLANVSGLEKRIAFKLGLTHYRRRALANLPAESEGGFHLVEHVLLRPGPADADRGLAAGDSAGQAPPFLGQPSPRDPYSGQVTFIFPEWIAAFGGKEKTEAQTDPEIENPIRDYVEKTVREETPAHLGIQVLWLTREEMAGFDAAYRTWLASMVIAP